MKSPFLAKLTGRIGVLSLALALSTALAQTPTQAPAPGTPEENSYIIGLILGAQMHGAGATQNDVSTAGLTRGFTEALQGKVPTQGQQAQAQAYITGIAQAALNKNKQKASDFLAKNKTEKGVVSTESGLQYRIVAPGDKKGRSPSATDQVKVQYRGKLLDGSEFDSSYSRPDGVTFGVSGLIKGWTEALQLMKPGAKWQLWVPPDLAYGDRAQPPKIPGGSLLVFDIELLEVLPPATPTGPAAPPGTPPKPKP